MDVIEFAWSDLSLYKSSYCGGSGEFVLVMVLGGSWSISNMSIYQISTISVIVLGGSWSISNMSLYQISMIGVMVFGRCWSRGCEVALCSYTKLVWWL